MRRAVSLVSLAAVASRPVVAVSPIEKVVQILKDMHAKGVAEMKSEQVEAAAFAQNCLDTQGRMEKEMGQLKDNIEEQNAKIAKAASASDGLVAEIGELTETGRLDSEDLASAKKVRMLENTDYLKTSNDYGESLDALSRAISLLSQKAVTNEEVVALQTSLLQVKSQTRSSSTGRRALTSMLNQVASKDAAPQGSSYGYQSAMDGVVAMLKDLQEKFKTELHALSKEETSAAQAFQVLEAGLNRKMSDDKETVSRKSQTKGEREADGAAAEGEKVSLNEDLSATKKDYRETKSSCNRNNALYAKQDRLRSDEAEAIMKAIEIMDGSVVGAAAENIAYHGEESSFIQLASTGDNFAVRDQLVSLLNTKASQFHSKRLSALSLRVQASPFKKVLNMIRDMVSKLQEQAVKEAEAHGWCEAKKGETKIDLEDKTKQQSDYTTEIERLSSKKEMLTQDVKQLAAEINNLSRDRGDATKQRTANKAENTKVIDESVAGQQAVANAVQVLNEFYAKGAEHAEADSGEGAVTEVYGGAQAQGKGVIDIMKVIETDLAREEAQRTAAEAQQADDYKKLMNSSEVDVEVKKTTKQEKSKQLIDSKKELTRVKGALADMTQAVAAIQEQMEALTKQCSAQISFEERVEMRENEIQSLKEALSVLKNVN